MLTEKERQGVTDILKKIPAQELWSLAETITSQMVHFVSREEATNAIVAYASSALDILKRKKMKKEYIFQYLYDVGHVVSPTFDKKATVKATLALWQSKEANDEIALMEEDSVCDTTEVPVTSTSFERELGAMAQQFVSWFYPLLNNGHVSNVNAEDNFGPHHFWPDCQMKINSPEYEQLVEGNSTVVQTLLSLIGERQLYFNPFDAQHGIRCHCDPHGLVVVLVGGVVHTGDSPVGIFEQKFGLIRDPSAENKWKIKFSELRLGGKEVDSLNVPPSCLPLEHSLC